MSDGEREQTIPAVEAAGVPGAAVNRAVVVINRRSGGADSLEQLAERVGEALRQRGLAPDLRIVEPSDLPAELRRIERGSAGLLVIGGGDGSIRCAAARAMEIDIPLAVLPLGTMNLVARDFGVPLTGAEAADALAEGEVVRIDVGEVNGRLFLHSVVLGIVPRMGSVRERSRGRRGLAALVKLVRHMWRIIFRERPLRAAIEFDGVRHRVSTFMIAISANRLRATAAASLARESLHAGELGIYWAKHKSRAGLLQLLGELGAGLWGLDDRVERHASREVVVRVPRWRALASIDGEPERLGAPLRFSVRPLALQVLVPPRMAREAHEAEEGDA